MSKLPDVDKRIYEAIAEESQIFPCHTNRASSLGHPCERFLVYCRLNWQDRKKIDVVRQMIFNGGKMIERHIAKVYLEKAKFDIIEMNRPYAWPEKQITAHLDFIAQDTLNDNMEFPVEAKSIAPYNWQKINVMEDFLSQKKFYYRAYPAQLTTYLLNSNREQGIFLLINKLTFQPKTIWITLNYAFAEELTQKAERINEYVAKKFYPDRIEYDPGVCTDCDFAHICLPDIIQKEMDFEDDKDTIDQLIRRETLIPLCKEYKDLDEELKEKFKGRAKLLIGDFIVTGKMIKKKTGVEYWKTDIQKLPDSLKKSLDEKKG